MEKFGKVIRSRAVDKPEYKNSGYKVVVHQAYKRKLPYVMADLDPQPAIYRRDYMCHLFIYYGYKAYDIYTEEHYKMLDEVNLEVQAFMESPYIRNLTSQLTPDQSYQLMQSFDDKEISEITKMQIKETLKHLKKNRSFVLTEDTDFTNKSEDYYLAEINKLRQQQFNKI
jgi:hypothetical protein